MEWVYRWRESARSPEGGREVSIVRQNDVCGDGWRHAGFDTGDVPRENLMRKKRMERGFDIGGDQGGFLSFS